MNNYIKYILLCIMVIILDSIWIFSNSSAYFNSIRKVQNNDNVKINLYAAPLAYLVIIFSLIHIAIPLTQQHINISDSILTKLYKSFIYGGAVGFCIYAIYNLTSLAIYKDFPINMAILDTLWGTILYSIVTYSYISLY